MFNFLTAEEVDKISHYLSHESDYREIAFYSYQGPSLEKNEQIFKGWMFKDNRYKEIHLNETLVAYILL